MKNYTPQPNIVFDLELLPESMLIIFYLFSRPVDWVIRKGQVQHKFSLSDKLIDKCWKQLQQLGLLTKRRVFNKLNPRDNVEWTFHRDKLLQLNANGKDADSEMRSQQNTLTAKRANGKVAASKIAVLPSTDVPTITDGIPNTELTEIMEACTKYSYATITKMYPDMDQTTYRNHKWNYKHSN